MKTSKMAGMQWLKRTLFYSGLAMMAMSLTDGTRRAIADILLSPRPVVPQTNASDEGQYPESRFGQGPAQPDLGRKTFAALEAEEMDAGDEALPKQAPTEMRPPQKARVYRKIASDDLTTSSGSSLSTGPATSPDVASASTSAPTSAPTSEGGTSTDYSRSPAGLVFDGEHAQTRTLPQARATVDAGKKLGNADASDAITTQIQRKGVQEIGVIAGDLGFFPKTIFVSRDVPVRLYVTGASKNTLCLMMDSFQIKKQVRANRIEEITFTPNVPGRYRFYCPVNGSEGTLVVKELTSFEAAAN